MTTIYSLAFFIFVIKVLYKKDCIKSEIINDLQNHIKFIDLDKIKKYNELCYKSQSKLLNLERLNLEQEFKLKKINFLLEQNKNNSFNQIIEIE